jgi:class 3 adenylate cyclase
MAAPRTQYARSGDVHLAYQVIGHGPRDIVFVLDWASHLEALWDHGFVAELVTTLAQFGRVLWFDMRGIGLSDRVAHESVAAEEWMDDVGAVMDAAESRRAVLIAHGHAAQMALLFAATYPERVTSVVVVNGFARLSRADDYPAGMPAAAQEAVLSGIEAGWGTGALGYVLGPSVIDQPGMQDWYGKVERYAASPGTALAKMRAVFDLDVRNVLPLIATPTLVVHNRGDQYIRPAHGRYLAEHIPGARLLELDSPDHWPLPDPELVGAIEEFVTGSRGTASDADRFLATVLVVDVVASTEHVIELGDRRWGPVLDRFEDTVQRALATYRGDLVNLAGDGVLATFDGPARAIRCACYVRDSVQANGLAVRCGLHAGEVLRRSGDVAGIAVHIGARVSAAADPGEVLVTRTVRDLVAGSGIGFADRGEHELKGLPERWPLYSVTGAA